MTNDEYVYRASKIDDTTWMIERSDQKQNGWQESLMRDRQPDESMQSVIDAAIARDSWA